MRFNPFTDRSAERASDAAQRTGRTAGGQTAASARHGSTGKDIVALPDTAAFKSFLAIHEAQIISHLEPRDARAYALALSPSYIALQSGFIRRYLAQSGTEAEQLEHTLRTRIFGLVRSEAETARSQRNQSSLVPSAGHRLTLRRSFGRGLLPDAAAFADKETHIGRSSDPDHREQQLLTFFCIPYLNLRPFHSVEPGDLESLERRSQAFSLLSDRYGQRSMQLHDTLSELCDLSAQRAKASQRACQALSLFSWTYTALNLKKGFDLWTGDAYLFTKMVLSTVSLAGVLGLAAIVPFSLFHHIIQENAHQQDTFRTELEAALVSYNDFVEQEQMASAHPLQLQHIDLIGGLGAHMAQLFSSAPADVGRMTPWRVGKEAWQTIIGG